ncbi:MAG: AarF/UbiB family protein [Acidimicrobiales bacterium]|nr:AarF/UbiB family protein [Acidimicrobiales bacterium]
MDEAGLDPEHLVAPRVFPRRFPDTTGRQLRARAWQIGRVTTRHFAPLAYRAARHQAIPENAFARPLRLTFEELGTTFMKFGQLVGSAPGVFGEEVANEFRSCLDTGPAVSFEQVRHVIEDDLGRYLEDCFAHVDPEPIGRASIAVVHRATTHDGRDVAVKVLRPGIERRVAIDLDLLEPLLDFVARQTGEQIAGSLLQMFDGFRAQMGEELDLRNEARAMAHYRVLLSLVDLPLVTVPEPLPELSGSRVLTMEFIDGVPVDDLSTIADFGHDPRPVVQQVVQAFLMTAIRWGNFHGDVHAGNLLFMPDGRIGVIDWGIVGRLDPQTHHFFRRMIAAALGDDSAWVDIAAHITRTYGPAIREGLGMDDDQLVHFVRSVMEPVLTRPFGDVSLAEMMQAPQQQVAKARGLEAQRLSVGAIVKRFREQRRLRAMVEDHGGVASEFDRGTFLLTKQLMYFERYGKMYLSDVSLFHDREFFAVLLEEQGTDHG